MLRRTISFLFFSFLFFSFIFFSPPLFLFSYRALHLITVPTTHQGCDSTWEHSPGESFEKCSTELKPLSRPPVVLASSQQQEKRKNLDYYGPIYNILNIYFFCSLECGWNLNHQAPSHLLFMMRTRSEWANVLIADADAFLKAGHQ